MMSPKKTQNLKNLFSLQTRRLVQSFKGFNSPLAQLTGGLLSCKWHENCGSMCDFKVRVSRTPATNVLIETHKSIKNILEILTQPTKKTKFYQITHT